MEKVKQSSRYCKFLAKAVIDGINERFSTMMQDKELIASAILVPRFKNEWTANEVILNEGKENCYDWCSRFYISCGDEIFEPN